MDLINRNEVLDFLEENFGFWEYIRLIKDNYDVDEATALSLADEVKDAIKSYNLHPTQKLKFNEDGTTTVSFVAGGRYEICWHLFRWGDNVKILAPKELQETYKELLTKSLNQL